MSRILNPSQAKAVYSAMCALNNVSGALWCRMPIGKGEEWADVREDDAGVIHIRKGPLRRFDSVESVVTTHGSIERYAGQHEFATGYDLNADRKQ